jgi:F5/8 type C domain
MVALLLAALLTAADDASMPAGGNLLRTAALVKNIGAPNAIRMTDGVAPVDGDAWDTPWTALFAANGVLEWDFGAVKHFEMLRLQADNNDYYHVLISPDGQTWTPLWTAKPVGIPGMQTRTSEPTNVNARFIRLTAEGGDSMYSVSEFEIFGTVADYVASNLKRITPPPPPPPAPINSAHLIVLAVGAVGAWLLYRARQENLARRPKA